MNEESSPEPLQEHLYRRERQSIPAARAFTRTVLDSWSIKDRVDDITLCVSELTTNALVHGVPPGRCFRLRLLYKGDHLRVEVHDSGGGEPRLGEVKDESGRGLLLVAALADAWGVAERVPGKIVWCAFAVDREAGQSAAGRSHGHVWQTTA
ncbi:ATP-binding protein [Streptomyces sp. NPDC088789]|uniref:ATP-binding protein n=1 Tax=Streptomyces sp. NPDC088789 TaxID=3365899 RepID=UPI0038159DD6